MRIKTRATIADLYKVEGKAELPNGEIVEMPPTGNNPGYASLKITVGLLGYTERTGRGRAFADNVGFKVDLPHRESFSPDAAYYTDPATGMRFCEGAPAGSSTRSTSSNKDFPASRARQPYPSGDHAV